MGAYYMSMTQTHHLYENMKNNNFTDESIAIGTIASLVGFYKIMRSPLGRNATRGLGLDGTGKVVRDYFKEMSKNVASKSGQLIGPGASQAGKMAAINKVANGIKSFWDKTTAGPNLYVASSVVEMVEETTEEALQDAIMLSSQAIEKAVEILNPEFKHRNKYNWLQSNPLERYLMSAAGGAIGGALFHGINTFENRFSGLKGIDQNLPKDVRSRLIQTIKDGGTEQIIAQIDKLANKGKTGLSTTLSTKIAQNVNSPDGKFYYEPAQTAEESQNHVLANVAKSYIQSLDAVINGNGVGYSDTDLIAKAISQDERIAKLNADTSFDIGIKDDYYNILDRMINAQGELNKATEKSDIDKWTFAMDTAKKEMEDLVSGKRTGEYAERLAFFLNRSVFEPFFDADVYSYARSKGLNYSNLPQAAKE
jgi:hypothetical protein